MRKNSPAFALLFLLFLIITPIHADALTFSLDFLYGGTSPAGASPWLTATFEDIAAGQVKLTLDSKKLISNENVVSWYFNYDPIVPGIIPIPVSGPNSQVQTGQNSLTAGNASGFDIQFSFTQQFGASNSAIYTLLGIGLSASSFDFMNEGGSFFSAAQVQGIGLSGAFAWIADSINNGPGPGPGPVPEPASLILLTVGLAGIGFFGHKRLTN